MNASLDTDIIIHLYKSGKKDNFEFRYENENKLIIIIFSNKALK